MSYTHSKFNCHGVWSGGRQDRPKKAQSENEYIYCTCIQCLALIFHALAFPRNFTVGTGIWPNIRLGNGIWAKFGLGNGIHFPPPPPPPSGPFPPFGLIVHKLSDMLFLSVDSVERLVYSKQKTLLPCFSFQ